MAAGLGVQFLTSACRTSRMFCTVVPGFRWGTTFGGALKHHIDESEGWTRPGVNPVQPRPTQLGAAGPTTHFHLINTLNRRYFGTKNERLTVVCTNGEHLGGGGMRNVRGDRAAVIGVFVLFVAVMLFVFGPFLLPLSGHILERGIEALSAGLKELSSLFTD